MKALPGGSVRPGRGKTGEADGGEGRFRHGSVPPLHPTFGEVRRLSKRFSSRCSGFRPTGSLGGNLMCWSRTPLRAQPGAHPQRRSGKYVHSWSLSLDGYVHSLGRHVRLRIGRARPTYRWRGGSSSWIDLPLALVIFDRAGRCLAASPRDCTG